MIAEERRRKLLHELRKSGALSIAEASARLRVSRMTVHRDLDELGNAGLLRKVHGGAVALPLRTPGAQRAARPFSERAPAAAAAKRQIAKHLAKLLAGAHNLVLDASSTVFPLAQELHPPSGSSLFILTNGIPLFQELRRRNAGFRLALSGGEPHPRTESLVGPLAIQSVEGLRFDFAVVSAVGLMEDEGAIYDATPEGVAVKQAFLSRAHKKVLALVRSKLNVLAPYLLGRLSEFDAWVTEDGVREVRATRAKSARGARPGALTNNIIS